MSSLRRGLKWPLRVAGLLVVVTAALFVASLIVLPAVLESRMVAALETMGLSDVRLDVRQVSLSGIDVTQLSVGREGRLGIETLRVSYDVQSIRQGGVRRVEISGLTFEARVRNGRVDLGPLDAIRESMSGRAADAGSWDRSTGRLPFESIALQSARIWIDLEGERVLIPFDATFDSNGSRLTVSITARPLGSVFSAAGGFDPSTDDLDMAVEATIGDLALWSRIVPPDRRPPGSIHGRVGLAMQVRGAQGARELEGHVSGSGIAWRGEHGGRAMAVDEVTIDLTGIRASQVGEEPPVLQGLDLALAFASLRIAGLPEFMGGMTARHNAAEEFALSIDAVIRDESNDGVSVSARASDPFIGEGAAHVSATVHGTMGLDTLRRWTPASAGLVLESGDAPGVEVSATLAAARARGQEDWRAVVTDGRVRADLGAARLLGAFARMESARVDVAFSGEVDASGGSFQLEDGSRLDLGGVAWSDPRQEWALASAADGGLSVDFGQPTRIEIPRLAEPELMTVSVPAWSARAHGLTITHRTSGTRMDDVDLTFAGDATMEDGTLVTSLGSGSYLHIQDLHTPAIRLDRVDPAAVLLDVSFSEPMRVQFERSAEPPRWEASVPALRVRVGESDVEVGDVLLRQLALDWTFNSAMTPAGGWIGSPRAGRLSVASGALRHADAPVAFGEVLIDLGPVGERLAAFDLAAGITRVKAGLRATAREAVGITSTTGTATIKSLLTEVEMSEGHPTSGGDGTPSLEEGFELQARFAAVGTAATGEHADLDVSIDLGTIGMEVLARGRGASRDPAELTWSADAKVDLRPEGGPIRIIGSGGGAEVGSGSIVARVAKPAGEAMAVVGSLTIADAAGRYPQERFDVSEISAEIPFAMGAATGSAGRFEIGTIWKGDDLIPGITGALSVVERRVDVALEWPILEGMTATASGWMEPRPDGPHGEFVFAVPPAQITERNQPADVFGALTGVKLGGTVAMDGRLAIAGSRIDPRITLRLEEVSVESKKWDISADGVAATVTLNQLTPPATPGDQRISVRHAKLGKLEVSDGSLAFRVEGPKSMFIEQTSWGWSGGRLYSHAIRLDPSDPKIELALFADHLQLQELAELVAPGAIRGAGTLYGRLPVAIAWPEISYGEAFLYAEPGLGRLQVLDMSGILQRLPAEAQGALRDFEYTVLKAKLMVGGTATIRLRGTSRDPAFPREIILDINIYGIDGLLDAAIVVSRVPSGRAGR